MHIFPINVTIQIRNGHIFRSTQDGANDSYWRRNEITVVITAISFFFPMCFEALGFLESYHPRKQLRVQLARIMALNLLNLYALIFALFDKISSMSDTLVCMKQNISKSRDELMLTPHHASTVFGYATKIAQNVTDSMNATSDSFTESYLSTLYDVTTVLIENTTYCYRIVVSCIKPTFNQTLITSMFLMNLTSTMLPEYMNRTNDTFLSYEDFDGFNLTNLNGDYDNVVFDNSTDEMIYWTGNLTDHNLTMVDLNETLRFKRDIEYDDNLNNPSLTNDEMREANFYNAMADFYANLQDGINFTTNVYGNMSDIYATITTFIDNITSTSWDGENITDYGRKCVLTL